MDLEDFAPAGASFRSALRPAASAEPVATFSAPRDLSLDEIWHGGRTNDMTRDGYQGDPFGGYRPGHGLAHEPFNKAERAAMQTAQAVHQEAAGQVRSALRGI